MQYIDPYLIYHSRLFYLNFYILLTIIFSSYLLTSIIQVKME